MTAKKETRYIKRETVLIPCKACGGTGKHKAAFEDQTPPVCYLCNDGYLESFEETDITVEVAMMQKQAKRNINPYHKIKI